MSRSELPLGAHIFIDVPGPCRTHLRVNVRSAPRGNDLKVLLLDGTEEIGTFRLRADQLVVLGQSLIAAGEAASEVAHLLSWEL